ncbi:hypothetical protein BDQ94DRAFT_103057 [Aspergillus welwitschiae]|uniref:Uncharacterized protein n=1 Tax=Aspergillus welwitschiae TaxID=1341132 RepID=A0A3F3QCK6_9EURO|nr:hypothetical protein BDQ94DRAFT_103057 [Aspergillus welwitschiae]RDH36865.1 hypothetical protein BDQ94DRAFT_103057 [Aspergillus welwitschiae]
MCLVAWMHRVRADELVTGIQLNSLAIIWAMACDGIWYRSQRCVFALVSIQAVIDGFLSPTRLYQSN